MTSTFAGFPADAFAFYADLELDNSRQFWAQNKHRYDTAVAGPMHDLLAELRDEFGQGRVFRPYRDVRFSADKSPYKDHQGGYVEVGPSCGYYVQVSSGGLMVGAGWHAPTAEQVTRYRGALDDADAVAVLREALDAQHAAGMTLGGDLLKTRPRGAPADHPNLDLLRHRSVLVSTSFAHDEPWLSTPTAGTTVRRLWRTAAPLVGWLADHVTGHNPDQA